MRARILIVDDEKNLADTLATILKTQAYEVQVAYDGVQGYQAALTFQPDLVLSDVAMPNRNGVEMAIMVREKMPDTSIVLISGQAITQGSLEPARRRGYHFQCLTKPIHPVELMEKLAGLLLPNARRQAA